MSLSIPLAMLLAIAAPAQDPAGGTGAAAVAPFVGDEVTLAVHLDLAKWDVRASLRHVLGNLADEEDVSGVTKVVGDWVEALTQAGAKDLFVLVDLTDMPGLPVVVVPLTGGADQKAIARVLSGVGPNAPIRWPASETIRGAVVAGMPDAVARIRAATPAARPELAAALAAGGDAAVRVAIVPSITQRRAIEEALPTLPAPIGGGPITTVTRGLRWATLALEPRPTVRAIIQAQDADAAKVLQEIAQDALNLLAREARDDPAMAELAESIGRMTPEAQGDRITLEADLEKSSALLSVPIRRARQAALRMQCTNNLKQIGLAMHNYHSAHNAFPAAYTAREDGTPLLSWRVHILPFLDQKDLYDEFHLDEPWDGPHNKALIPRMPKLYACPGGDRTLARDGKTTYLTPRGPATIFPGAAGIKIQEITDGTSNTILVVDAAAAAAVVWTEPDDWEVPPAAPARGLFGHHPGGTNVAFADGGVRFIKETIAPAVLRALMSRNGGEVTSGDDL
jgi:prepilin-type processing-associated H-X9-DG protein